MATTLEELHAAISDQPRQVGLIITRGYLHEGHGALVHSVQDQGRLAVLCVFLNQRQFGPGEDYALYPRDSRHDVEFAEQVGVDVLWLARDQDVYPPGFCTEVRMPQLENALHGVTGPEVLRAQLTAVVRLIGLARAQAVYYGEQDWYKAAALRIALTDLAIGTVVETTPTKREADGLALRSLNERLRPEERRSASLIYGALQEAQELFSRHGEVEATRLLGRTSAALTRIPGFRLQYVHLVDPATLSERRRASPGDLLMAGGYFGRTRLDDAVRLPDANG
ncbi:MAG: pantoate--beta-alanine ligase [Thermaerobacter sp.]|nr:pantoate--beta-alanine ligase [Thermaerobacter sp.]